MPTRTYHLKDPFPDEEAPRDSFVADAPARKTLTVSEITRQVKGLFEETFAYPVYVEGELSDPKVYPSGHFWFDLKDATASIKSVMWRENVRRMKFEPVQGLQVICLGRVTFYPPRGEVKFEVLAIEPKGMGSLQLAFEQLKEKLEKEGFFSEERKRPLPLFPERVGIVTSPRGAAIDDMLKLLRGRVEVVLRPVRVQGEGAATAVADAIAELNEIESLDLIIAGRGGGSLEDLWAFNEEAVARAIFLSRLPVISAVGHQEDWTIADGVADVRASTPTNAAEIVLERRRELIDRWLTLLSEPAFTEPGEWLNEQTEKVDDFQTGLLEGLTQPLLSATHRLRALHGDLLGCSPQAIILHQAERLHRLQGMLSSAIVHQLRQTADQIGGYAGRLQALSPLAVLDRGYSITFDPQGNSLREAKKVKPGDRIRTRLSKGQVISRVESVGEGSDG